MSHTITAVKGQREWQGKFGAMISYDIDVTGPDGQFHGDVELAQKPETKAPYEGLVLEGTIEQGKFGPKFKKTPPATTGGGGGGPRKKDPDERGSIEKQVAWKGAVELVAALYKPDPAGGNVEQAKEMLTTFFDHGVNLIQGHTVMGSDAALPDLAPTPSKSSVTADVRPTMDDVRALYKTWAENLGDEAEGVFKNKLMSVGVEPGTDGTSDQRQELYEFLGGA